MSDDYLFTCTLPLLGGFLLALFVVDLLVGKRDRAAKRSRVVLVAILSAVEGGLITWRVLHTSHPEPLHTVPRPPLTIDPPSTAALTTAAYLDAASSPVHDPTALRSMLAPDSAPPSLTAWPDHEVGDRIPFQLHDRMVEAELIHVHGHVHSWLVGGVETDREALVAATDRFANEVFPTLHETFCPACPTEEGTDIHILNYEDPDDGMFGFFSPDTGTFYVNLVHRSPEGESYLATLAHELQHQIHWHNDPNEERWLDEGLAELAKLLAGFDPGSSDEVFRDALDTQLNRWPYEREGMPPAAHYGASYRFALYLWEQLGDEFIRDLARHPANGLSSVDAVLAAHGSSLTADSIFADWVLANAVDEGEYAYAHEEWKARLPTWFKATFYRYPMDIQTAVPPYATHYFKLENTVPSLIRFSGTTQARLLPADPHSGETCWWSNVAHHSDTHLAHSFDLSALSRATLRFWMWYDLQSSDSHVYLSASRDGGQTWTVLQGRSRLQRDVDYGWGYAGQSKGWIEEQVDLSPYAGGKVWVRFDYVTRHATGDKGFLLDDLSIPELGLEDPCEQVGDWQAEGFILAGPMVPVRWVVQVIDVYREGHSLRIYRMSLDEQQTGQLELDLRPLGGLLGNRGRGILAVSALARGTTEPLTYHCEILRR
jgi:immune inhibitor A